MGLSELSSALHGLTAGKSLNFWSEDEQAAGEGGIRELCKIDRYYLLVRACNRSDALHPWIYERCREVEARPDGCLDLWAREHYKSTIITFAGIIQEVLRDPEITICIFSHTKQVARGFFRQIKLEFEGNALLQRIFPDIIWKKPQFEAPRWSEDSGLILKRKTNPKESTLEAWGLVDGQPTSKHFALRVYDDVVTDGSVTTSDQIAKTTAAWELSDNLGTADGKVWTVGTRYSFADTYQSMIDRGAVLVRRYPATHDGSPDGVPVLLTPAQWEDKKIKQGPATIACQMLQNPLAGQMSAFNVRDLQKYEVRPLTLNVYIMVDPARSMKKGSAMTAMSVIGADTARNKYLLDGYNHKMDLRGRWEGLKGLRKHWMNQPGIQGVYVGYESYGAQSDLDYFVERMEIENDPFPIVELAWPRDGEGSKNDRIQRLGPDIRSHRLYVSALISNHGVASWWTLGEGKAGGLEMVYTPYTRPSSNQQRAINDRQPSLICKVISRKDLDSNQYDLTNQFINQVMQHPFGMLVDLIDATSRLTDMDYRPPVIIKESELEPEVTVD